MNHRIYSVNGAIRGSTYSPPTNKRTTAESPLDLSCSLDPATHEKLSRRASVQVMGAGLLGLLTKSIFPSGLIASEPQAERPKELREPKDGIFPLGKDSKDPGVSLMLIVLQGGASQNDFFPPDPANPKIDPVYQSFFKRIETTAKREEGIFLPEELPRTARVMDRVLVLGLQGKESSHDLATGALLVDGKTKKVSSDFYADSADPSAFIELEQHLRTKGNPHFGYMVFHNSVPTADMPKNPDPKPYSGVHAGNINSLFLPWSLGQYKNPAGGKFDPKRYREVRSLIDAFDSGSSAAYGKAGGKHDIALNMADRILDGWFRDAMTIIDKLPEKEKERYGKNSFGIGVLTGRELINEGARVVVVSHGDWDTHKLARSSLKRLFGEFDKGYSAIIEDLPKMKRPTLVIVVTEFGRTPKINDTNIDLAGTDHHPDSFPMMLAGHGITGGRFLRRFTHDGNFKGVEPFKAEQVGETVLNLEGWHRKRDDKWQASFANDLVK